MVSHLDCCGLRRKRYRLRSYTGLTELQRRDGFGRIRGEWRKLALEGSFRFRCKYGKSTNRRPAETPPCSALVHLPITFAVVANSEQPVLGVMPLAALRADQIPAPRGSLPIIIFCNRKCRSATAGHQKHTQRHRTGGPTLRAEFHFPPPFPSRSSCACWIAESSFAVVAISE